MPPLIQYQYCPTVDFRQVVKLSIGMSLRVKKAEIDLKLQVLSCHSRCTEGRAYEYRPDDLRGAHGFGSAYRVPALCGSLSGRLQKPELFRAGTVPLPRPRPTYLSRKSARHRGVFVDEKPFFLISFTSMFLTVVQ